MLIGQKITVAGAGIAGLAVARALAMRGAVVTVLEQADAIREVGAGLQITPNGMRVLHALGLGSALERKSLRAGAVELLDGPTGGRVIRLDLAQLRPGDKYLLVHRADLVDVLAEGARDAGVEIRLGQTISAVRAGPSGAVVTTGQGDESVTPLLIGADGLHSPTRAALNGSVAPFFTHQIAWRAVIPERPGAEPVARVYMGPGRHLVSYPLRDGRQRNIVAVEERRRWADESWSSQDDPIAVQQAFAAFAPEVGDWLDRIEEVFIWGLFRHPVAQNWSGPNMAILGDAAHPTLPFLAQGANMALEDAWVLAAALAGADDLAAGLGAYQAGRQDRVRRVVAAANANARNYHLRGPMRLLAHAGLRTAGALAPGVALRRFDWLYGHDVTL